jgi:maltose O-acetyltransferase
MRGYASMGRRTVRRLSAHVLHVLDGLLGDDWVGRTLRRSLLRRFGVTIAGRSTLHGGTYLTHPARLFVGERCFVNRNCYFDLEGEVSLGDGSTVGHGVTFITTRHDLGDSRHRAGATSAAAIAVGAGAWIGANATLLAGVTIGNGAVVAAGAVVVSDVAPDTLVGGVPAKLLRHLTDNAAPAQDVLRRVC